MWIDDESDIADGAFGLGLSVHDFMTCSKEGLRELSLQKLSKSIGKDIWPYENLMSASKLLSLSDDDRGVTANKISELKKQIDVKSAAAAKAATA